MALFRGPSVPSFARMSPAVTVGTSTSEFCTQLVTAGATSLPPQVARAARRSLFNVLGTSVGAARTTAVEVLLATAREQDGTGDVTVAGRDDTVDAYWGALLAGTAAHLDDFDDTHLATVIHPGAAVLGTLLALAPELDVDGERYLTAFALGCESQLRIGNAVSPKHYDRGWHITGTCGVFGAAVSASLLLGLSAAQLEQALAIVSTMVLGHREGFGSMTKPFHPGKAAANGVLAARLAAAGLTGIADPLGDGGVLPVFADGVDRSELTGSWDRDWELEYNAFKPYPCGIVAHPAIDAARAASAELDDPAAITAVELTCHPLVPELMGRRQPRDGLQARFSAYHAAAVGLLDGQVGLVQFGDDRAVAPDVERLRGQITLLPSDDCARDEATIRVERAGRDPISVHVPHARGSLDRPLTHEELFDKVDRLVEPVLGTGAARRIAAAVDALAGAAGLDQLVAAIRPGGFNEGKAN
jgi:2-methylcitrate dehydratase PrpD